MLGATIARVNGRQFHRNAVAVVHAAPGTLFADGVDGVDIILIIALGIGLGHRRFTKHIE